ncbi:hypothetical protein CRUP_012959 [Coryphaenoides rupestris]|nr:hypothetical protein CRUP_012959 [Coryphaenoides rupestris]
MALANQEMPTSNLSSAKARAMLRRHSVIGPEIRLTYVPANQVEEYRAALHLPPLASLAAPSPTPTASPEPPQPGGAATTTTARALRPLQTQPAGPRTTVTTTTTARPPGPLHTQPAGATTTTARAPGPLQTQASTTLPQASRVPGPTPGLDLSAARAAVPLRAKANSSSINTAPTITPASDTSWQIPRSPLLREKGGDRRDGGSEEQAKRRGTTAATATATVPTVPTVRVSAAVDGTNQDGEEQEEEEDMEEEMLNIPRVQSWGRPRSWSGTEGLAQ